MLNFRGVRDAHLAHLQQAWRAVLRQHPEAAGELSLFFFMSNDGGKAADSWYWMYQWFRYELIKVGRKKMKFDQDDHVGMIELQH